MSQDPALGVEVPGTLLEKEAHFIASQTLIDPELAALSDRLTLLQKKATIFLSKLRPYSEQGASGVSELLQLDASRAFEPGSAEAASLPTRLDLWESEVRAMAIRFAEITSSEQSMLATARAQLVSMGVSDSRGVEELIQESVPSFDIRGAQSVLRAFSVAEAGVEVSIDEHSVTMLKGLCASIETTHRSRARVVEVASNIMDTYFIAMFNRINGEHPALARLSREWIVVLLGNVEVLLGRLRAECQSTEARLVDLWRENDVPACGRITLQTTPEHETPPPIDAAQRFVGAEALTVDRLEVIVQLLEVSSSEGAHLNSRLERAQEGLQLVFDRDALSKFIIDTDTQLCTIYRESETFERNSKNPNRLQDRSGKGRIELANEEATRKSFQRNTRKLLEELQKALNLWEHKDGQKFNSELLSEHGCDVLGAKSESMISSKTSLMHLEANMTIGGPRRSTGDERAPTGEHEGGRDTPPPKRFEEAAMTPAQFADPAAISSARGPKCQNPFAKMTTSRKSTAFFPIAVNRLDAGKSDGHESKQEGPPKLSASSFEAGSEQENSDPALP